MTSPDSHSTPVAIELRWAKELIEKSIHRDTWDEPDYRDFILCDQNEASGHAERLEALGFLLDKAHRLGDIRVTGDFIFQLSEKFGECATHKKRVYVTGELSLLNLKRMFNRLEMAAPPDDEGKTKRTATQTTDESKPGAGKRIAPKESNAVKGKQNMAKLLGILASEHWDPKEDSFISTPLDWNKLMELMEFEKTQRSTLSGVLKRIFNKHEEGTAEECYQKACSGGFLETLVRRYWDRSSHGVSTDSLSEHRAANGDNYNSEVDLGAMQKRRIDLRR